MKDNTFLWNINCGAAAVSQFATLLILGHSYQFILRHIMP